MLFRKAQHYVINGYASRKDFAPSTSNGVWSAHFALNRTVRATNESIIQETICWREMEKLKSEFQEMKVREDELNDTIQKPSDY